MLSYKAIRVPTRTYVPTIRACHISVPDTAGDADTAGARALVSAACTATSICSWTAAESNGPDDVPVVLPALDTPGSADPVASVASVTRSEDIVEQSLQYTAGKRKLEKESSSEHLTQGCYSAWRLGDNACTCCSRRLAPLS